MANIQSSKKAIKVIAKKTDNNHELKARVKNLIKELKQDNANIENNIFKSAFNVNLDTLIGYKNKDMEYKFLDDYKEKKGEIVEKGENLEWEESEEQSLLSQQ